MKRIALVLMALALVAAPAFSQLRLDIGIDVPRGVGAAFQGSAEVSQETVDFFNNYFIPFPEAGLYYQYDLGMFKFGLGARAYTFIVETILWPNAFAEVHLGPVVVEAQVGGGLFFMVGLANQFEAGKVFLPDLSAWFKLGKKQNLRLGGGILGLYLPELTTEGFGFVYYLGGKVAINL